MAVYTEVSNKEARELLRRLQLGKLLTLRGIEGGIENTNYFVTSEAGEYVLTLFERLSAEQLPFYLHLMHHLWPSVPFYNYARLFHRLRPVLKLEGSRIEGLMVGPRRRAIAD